MHVASSHRNYLSPTNTSSSPDSNVKTSNPTISADHLMQAFATKSTARCKSTSPKESKSSETAKSPLSQWQEKLRPSRSEVHPFFSIGGTGFTHAILFDDAAADVDEVNNEIESISCSLQAEQGDATASHEANSNASDSLLALHDGQLPGDDATVIASSKGSGGKLSHPTSTRTCTTEPYSESTCTRAEKIQNKIKATDMVIESTMRMLSQLQMERQDLLDELLACTVHVAPQHRTTCSPVIPGEVSFAPKRRRSRKQHMCRKSDGKGQNKQKN